MKRHHHPLRSNNYYQVKHGGKLARMLNIGLSLEISIVLMILNTELNYFQGDRNPR